MDLQHATTVYWKHWAEVYRQHGYRQDYPEDLAVVRGAYWYLSDPQPFIGTRGMIVRKLDGAKFVIGGALNQQAACWAFERGILDGKHDLIITSCLPDLDAT